MRTDIVRPSPALHLLGGGGRAPETSLLRRTLANFPTHGINRNRDDYLAVSAGSICRYPVALTNKIGLNGSGRLPRSNTRLISHI